MFSSSFVDEGNGKNEELDDTFVDYPPTPVTTGCDVNPFSSAEGLVTLPERYCPGKTGRTDGEERPLKERENDLTVALQWLRQEVARRIGLTLSGCCMPVLQA
ncbi:hypothetical protein LSAT2_021083 [Lamellibrachia satsuma]|nr:hypothetical protein LSAT2_021083 [Lamellibrachia satsuma]